MRDGNAPSGRQQQKTTSKQERLRFFFPSPLFHLTRNFQLFGSPPPLLYYASCSCCLLRLYLKIATRRSSFSPATKSPPTQRKENKLDLRLPNRKASWVKMRKTLFPLINFFFVVVVVFPACVEQQQKSFCLEPRISRRQ